MAFLPRDGKKRVLVILMFFWANKYRQIVGEFFCKSYSLQKSIEVLSSADCCIEHVHSSFDAKKGMLMVVKLERCAGLNLDITRKGSFL